MTRIHIQASSEYDVIIGHGLLEGCGERIRAISRAGRAVIVCGDIVDGLYADTVQSSLESSGFNVFKFVYPHGEGSKNIGTLSRLLSFMAQKHIDRSDIVVALGGGVTGDLAGFAAASYMRGIDFVQIPTTLLAMVDSSVGGKTAVDLPEGKNLVGAFHQPRLVICDADTLATLPKDVFSDGCAEVIKYAVLSRPDILELLESRESSMEALIAACIGVKRDIVAQDEFDRGARQLLNLGHTVAHAVEKHSGFAVAHGRAVAIGLAVMCRAFADSNCTQAVLKALESLELPVSCEYPLEELCKLMFGDKKCHGVNITLVVPHALGSCELRDVKADELFSVLEPGWSETK